MDAPPFPRFAARALAPGETPLERSSPTHARLRAGLRELMILRSIAVAGQAAAILVSSLLGVDLPLPALALAMTVLVLLNAAMWLRLRSPREVGYAEIVANIALDLAGFTVLLALSGGAGNPFSVIYVLHCVLMALLLPAPGAAAGTAAAIACYFAIAQANVPLTMQRGEAIPEDLLMFGRGVGLALTAGFAAYFTARIMTRFRAHDRRLDHVVREALRDDAVLRIGALAAGAAHELARPLATAAVLAGELAHYAEPPGARRDASLLAAQLAVCRGVIDEFTAAAGHARSAGGGRVRVDVFLESIAATCRTLHPHAHIVTDWSGIAAPPDIFGEQGLRQALSTLLNNAVDASPRLVRFAGACDGDALRLSIEDHGPGVAAADMPKLGRVFFTTKPAGKGTGLGLVVAARTIERLGGSVRWQSIAREGTRVDVLLPLGPLTVGEAHGAD